LQLHSPTPKPGVVRVVSGRRHVYVRGSGYWEGPALPQPWRWKPRVEGFSAENEVWVFSVTLGERQPWERKAVGRMSQTGGGWLKVKGFKKEVVSNVRLCRVLFQDSAAQGNSQ
jgi:hypothetical protein